MLATARPKVSTQRFGVRRFLTRRVLVLTSIPFAILTLSFWGVVVLAFSGTWAPTASFPKIDFLAFWAASSLAVQGTASLAYNVEAIWRVQNTLPGNEGSYLPWLNPPNAFLLILPLSLLPVGLSFWQV